MGLGNGAVFQLVPHRFRAQIGVATGVVGAVGGIGGFLLPVLLGGVKQRTGSFTAGFIVLASLACSCLIVLRILVSSRTGWRVSWKPTVPAEAYETT